MIFWACQNDASWVLWDNPQKSHKLSVRDSFVGEQGPRWRDTTPKLWRSPQFEGLLKLNSPHTTFHHGQSTLSSFNRRSLLVCRTCMQGGPCGERQENTRERFAKGNCSLGSLVRTSQNQVYTEAVEQVRSPESECKVKSLLQKYFAECTGVSFLSCQFLYPFAQSTNQLLIGRFLLFPNPSLRWQPQWKW